MTGNCELLNFQMFNKGHLADGFKDFKTTLLKTHFNRNGKATMACCYTEKRKSNSIAEYACLTLWNFINFPQANYTWGQLNNAITSQ